jgi:hypothetical protein
MTYVVEHLPSKYQALSTNPSNAKTIKNLFYPQVLGQVHGTQGWTYRGLFPLGILSPVWETYGKQCRARCKGLGAQKRCLAQSKAVLQGLLAGDLHEGLLGVMDPSENKTDTKDPVLRAVCIDTLLCF